MILSINLAKRRGVGKENTNKKKKIMLILIPAITLVAIIEPFIPWGILPRTLIGSFIGNFFILFCGTLGLFTPEIVNIRIRRKNEKI